MIIWKIDAVKLGDKLYDGELVFKMKYVERKVGGSRLFIVSLTSLPWFLFAVCNWRGLGEKEETGIVKEIF